MWQNVLIVYDMFQHNYGNRTIVSYTIRLVVTLLVVLILSRAGQRLHNNVKHLKRRIGKIYILSLVGMYMTVIFYSFFK